MQSAVEVSAKSMQHQASCERAVMYGLTKLAMELH